jgi:hypothetical protein
MGRRGISAGGDDALAEAHAGLLSAHPGASQYYSVIATSTTTSWWRGHGCVEERVRSVTASRRRCSPRHFGTKVVRLVILLHGGFQLVVLILLFCFVALKWLKNQLNSTMIRFVIISGV